MVSNHCLASVSGFINAAHNRVKARRWRQRINSMTDRTRHKKGQHFVDGRPAAHRNKAAAAQMGMHVPGPLTSSSCGRRRITTVMAGVMARRVVKLDVSHDWPTSRLRGMTSTMATVDP